MCLSSDLRSLQVICKKADIACMFRGSRKFRDVRERKVQVWLKFYVTHVVKVSVFRKSRVVPR